MGETDKEQRPLLTTAEAAAELGLAVSTVRNAVTQGIIQAEHYSRVALIPVEEVERYRLERLGKRGGYRPRSGRKRRAETQPEEEQA